MKEYDLMEDGDFRDPSDTELKAGEWNYLKGEWRPAGSDTWQSAELHILTRSDGSFEEVQIEK